MDWMARMRLGCARLRDRTAHSRRQNGRTGQAASGHAQTASRGNERHELSSGMRDQTETTLSQTFKANRALRSEENLIESRCAQADSSNTFV